MTPRMQRLLAMVADRPDGAKVHMPSMVRAFTPTQGEVIVAIEWLIGDGKLDAKTLRRPTETSAPAPEPEPTTPAAPRPAPKGDGAARHADAPSPILRSAEEPLGSLLECFSDEFETLRAVAQRFGVKTPQKIVRHARTLHERGLVEQAPPENGQPFCLWRRAGRQKPIPSAGPADPVDPPASPTVESAAVADDSPEPRSALEQPEEAVDIKVNRPARRDPTQPPPGYRSRPEPITIAAPEAASGLRGSPQRKAVLAQAQRRIDQGLNLGGRGVGPHVKVAQASLERQQADERRLADPIEQAKTIIRRAGYQCWGAAISGGPADMFYVGNNLKTKPELLALAERLRTTRTRRPA